MRTPLPFVIRAISCLLFIQMIGLSLAYGQKQNQQYVDDPNLDQIPKWYVEMTNNSVKGPSQVITINDYDNFYLGLDFAESHISVNPTDPTQFFTAYNTDGTHNTMNGHDWNNATAVSWGTTIRGDVLTAYDASGNLYYENMYGSSILGCKVVRSANNGQSWSSAVTAISGVDKNWLAADQTSGPYSNYVYSVMTAGGGSGNFSRSTNLGASWTTTFTPATQSLPGMMVCVGPNGATNGGAVYVVTNSGSAFASTYTFYRSLNGGSTFSFMSSQSFAGYVGTNVSGRNSVENMRTRPYPFITADNSSGSYRGRLYLVYASNWPAGNGNKPDVWCRYSTNGGSSWSSAHKINDDASTQNNHQWGPATWCDLNTGRLYVHWLDTRDTPTSDSAMMYASYSDNGGLSFVANQKLSNEKMKINCSTCGGGGTPRYQGDYTSIVSNSKVSMSSWPDYRWGSFASFTAYFPDYAMRLSNVVKSPEGLNTVLAEVPGVKLYTENVIFTASMETPPSGSFSIAFPSGNTLSTFPGSVPIQVTSTGVPSGLYTLSVTGKGPNGTPVHKRTISISVVEPAPPVADFTASSTTPFVGNQVDFTDLSTNAPTSWAWIFNPATVNFLNGTNASSQNPQVAFLNPGLYTVTLVATNVYGSGTKIKNNYINASNCTYCSATSNNATEEWISHVTFHTINNSVNSTSGYEDFTSLSTDVMPGSTYNASVSVGSVGSWPEYYRIYIDWNQNCNLSDAGEIYDLGSASGPNTLTTNITIPASASTGATRMRIIIKYNSNSTSCETFSYGQVEDYSLNVLSQDITLNLTALLEGPFNGVGMDANLGSLIPLNQPFNTAPWNYSGSESVGTIPNTNVVGWVLVDLRNATSAANATAATSVARQAAFILTNGSIVDLDGSSALTFPVSINNNLYVAVWHRNHIGIMSKNAIPPLGNTYTYNFSTGVNQVYGGVTGHKLLATGKWGMFSGDGNADGNVNLVDESPVWESQAGDQGLLRSDFNLDGESNNVDKDDFWEPNVGEGTQIPL